MNELHANGAGVHTEVYAPTCAKCGSSDYIIVKDYPQGCWAYYCTRCERPIPYEEFQEGNP